MQHQINDSLPGYLHEVAFLPTLRGQADEEQRRKWLPLAENYAIIGCCALHVCLCAPSCRCVGGRRRVPSLLTLSCILVCGWTILPSLVWHLHCITSDAQTELGHGSNVRALETTATFVPETDEIELHSPTLTSTKYAPTHGTQPCLGRTTLRAALFCCCVCSCGCLCCLCRWWPGCLGKTATHAVVYASLLLPQSDGTTKDMGIHAFMLQIRSMEDHTDMPGVMIGTIGPKFGANGIDNGWMRMNRVRVPRRNMLMRFSTLDRDGQYKKIGHQKALYGVRSTCMFSLLAAASGRLWFRVFLLLHPHRCACGMNHVGSAVVRDPPTLTACALDDRPWSSFVLRWWWVPPLRLPVPPPSRFGTALCASSSR